MINERGYLQSCCKILATREGSSIILARKTLTSIRNDFLMAAIHSLVCVYKLPRKSGVIYPFSWHGDPKNPFRVSVKTFSFNLRIRRISEQFEGVHAMWKVSFSVKVILHKRHSLAYKNSIHLNAMHFMYTYIFCVSFWLPFYLIFIVCLWWHFLNEQFFKQFPNVTCFQK